MSATKDLSAKGLLSSDSKLASVDHSWLNVASNEVIEKTQKALESKKHQCIVVENKLAALEELKKFIPSGVTVFSAGSTTLAEIGFTEYFKTQTAWTNKNAVVLAETDPAKQADLRRQAMTSDYFLSSVCAVTEEGEAMVVDLSGSRVGGFGFAAKKVVVVVGANKIVSNMEAAMKRTFDFCVPVESARARVVYGVPGSAANNLYQLRGTISPNRFCFIIVKESLGF